MKRWLGAGVSGLTDSRRAAADASRVAVNGRGAGLLLVSAGADRDPVQLAAGVGDVAPGVPIIGGSVGGAICQDGSTTGQVLVVALGGAGFTVATGCAEVSAVGLGRAGELAAGCLSAIDDRPHQVLLLLTDATTGDQQEILRGAYRSAGAGVPLVGGACPAPPKGGSPWQLHDGRVVRGAVVAAAIDSDAPFGVGVGHGWEPVGEPMLVTASTAAVIHELDDESALSRYLQRLSTIPVPRDAPRLAAGVWDEAAFVKAAATHPLGLRRRSGALIRSVVGAEPKGGSLVCAAEVPQGALVWLMHGTATSVLTGMDQACAQATATVGPAAPVGLLAFDCVARQRILTGAGPDDVQQEAARLAGHAGGSPFAGIYTGGEIARTQGLGGFHNKTVVVLAVG